MFIGEYEHALDGKNRLNIPRKFREEIESSQDAKGLYITRGLDDCLFLFAASQWDTVVKTIRNKPFVDAATRRFHRIFFSNTTHCELDAQGRVLIPENLKNAVGIDRNVTVVGVYDRIEVWDRQRWKSMKESSAGEYESLAQQLF